MSSTICGVSLFVDGLVGVLVNTTLEFIQRYNLREVARRLGETRQAKEARSLRGALTTGRRLVPGTTADFVVHLNFAR